MGWFWADSPAASASAAALPPNHPPLPTAGRDDSRSPPPGCPMHKHQKSADAMTPASSCPVKHTPSASAPPTSCPVPHNSRSAEPAEPQASTLSQYNPLNFMFRDLSQAPAESQSEPLPTSREASTIPRGDGTGNWEYPSPQQMYNALLRKGYSDTDVTAVESMVSVHNFLNEGAWAEIMEWEKRFSGGLYKGLQLCSRGETGFDKAAKRFGYESQVEKNTDDTSLMRFQGRPKDMTPKAAMIQVMGWIYPQMFATEPPFDRHDWYVSRNINGQQKEVRYVIDYYSGQPEASGEPVFYLDVRPAFTPTGAAERAIRWGSDVWWRASGAEVRDAKNGRLF